MPLAISNIAWPAEQEREAAELLQRLDVEGVEIAPTLVWPDPLAAADAEIDRYREFWARRGIRIVALQALLFGRPEMQLFEQDWVREQMFQRLAGMIRLASRLRAEVLVFGSPKNRLVGEGCHEVAWQLAVEFFRRLGRVAANHGVWFCLEPNPVEYGCDFINFAADGLGLVEEVDQPGFGLHLDSAAMGLSHDPIESIFQHAGDWWRHFHVSEPNLAKLGWGGTRHEDFAAALTHSGFPRWISIEMRSAEATSLTNVREAIEFVRRMYPKQAGLAGGPRHARSA